MTNKLSFYIDLSESKSLYSEPLQFNGNKNIWDYYFEQSKPIADEIIYATTKYEGCTNKIWRRSHLKRVHTKAVKHLKYSTTIQLLLNERKRTFPSSVIGVHIRKTDHATEVPPVSLEVYIDLLKNKISKRNYKNIFIATDDETIIKALYEKFSEITIISNTVTRSGDGQAVHKNEAFENKFQLGAEAILDAYTLSLCDEVILTNSNLSYCALYMNPFIKFQLVDGFAINSIRQYTRDIFYNIRYIIFHQVIFIELHRKWRYFLNRFRYNSAAKNAV